MYSVFTGKKFQLHRSICTYKYLATRVAGYVVGTDNVSLFKAKWKIAVNVQNGLNAIWILNRF